MYDKSGIKRMKRSICLKENKIKGRGALKHFIFTFFSVTLILVIVPVICVKSFENKLMQVLGENLYKADVEAMSQLSKGDTFDDDTEVIPKNPDTSDKMDYPSETVSVYLHDKGIVENIELQPFLCGVLRGEMQPTYETEALKAQAVAAYTYLVYQKLYNYDLKKDAHFGADICTDPSHCKAYLSEETARSRWGDAWYDKYDLKIKAAVADTLHEAIVYEDKVINAVFFSVSSGKTESAENVWGYAIPYLVEVDSIYDTSAEGFESEVVVSVAEFKDTLSRKFGCAFGESTLNIENINRSGAGGIITVTVGKKTISGTEFRTAFGLRSSNVVIEVENGNVVFKVKGYGHGVGMSQYGANQLAKQGYTYDEILRHYYLGTSLTQIEVFS